MAISISVIPSTKQLVSGIPETISIVTNISATIFYTLDNTEPTTSSNVYVGAIKLPTNQQNVVLKTFASNGIETSTVLQIRYAPDISHTRYPHAKATLLNPTTACGCSTSGSSGSLATYSQPVYGAIDTPFVPYADKVKDGYGYAPDIYPMRTFNEPIPIYDLRYSETNSKGEFGKDIGTLPAKITYYHPPAAPEQSNANSKTYNPKAWVIFHDGRDPNNNSANIFKPFYEGEAMAKSMFGARLQTIGREGDNYVNGGFVRYQLNPQNQTVTFYYYDNRTCRWIISTEPYVPTSLAASLRTNNYNILAPNTGYGHVFRWIIWRGSNIV